MKENNLGEDDDNYSELQSLDYESNSNNKSLGIMISPKNAIQGSMSNSNNNIMKDTASSRETSTTCGRQQYR